MSSLWTLRRSTTDGKLAGVCSALARHADVDPLLVRVAAVLLALSGGIGLVLYAAAWFLVPDENGHAPADQHLPSVRRWKRSSLITVLVIACIVVAGGFSTVAPFSVASAFVLALIWYFGYYKNRPSRPDSDDRTASRPGPPGVAAPLTPPLTPPFRTFTGPPTPFTEAAAAWQRRITEVQRQSTQVAAAPTPWPTMPAPAPVAAVNDPTPDPRAEWDRQLFLSAPDPVGLYVEPTPAPVVRVDPRRSVAARRLRLSWLLATGLALAGLGIADVAGAPITAAIYLAAALFVTGIALVLGAFLGRARGILPMAWLLALAIGVSSVATQLGTVPSWSDPPAFVYTTQASIPTTQAIDGGTLTVDYRDLDITEDQTVAVSVGTGGLEILRPADGNVRIEYTVDTGAVDLPGNVSRVGKELTAVVEPVGGVEPDEPLLTIEATVGTGVLEVKQ